MDKILSVNKLSVKTKERTIVSNVSFDIYENEVVLLSGANGSGKSTILHAIMRDYTHGKIISGNIIVQKIGDVLLLNKDAIQHYRSAVAYVPQHDNYTEMGRNITVRDIISSSNEAYSGKALTYNEVNELIDNWIPCQKDNRRIFDAKSKPKRFSGGEQRLLSVLSVVATRNDAGLFIIDEPLNNLDFSNARNISNLLNSVIRNNQKASVLMVTHCRIFPFITREIKLTENGIKKVEKDYVCHSCIGEPNKSGFYEMDK